MDAFAGSSTQLVAEVDCEGAGRSLCMEHGIHSFPILKWGDPSALEDSKGGHDYDSMKQFADENLKPQCSPTNIDLCEDEKKAEINKYQEMGYSALSAMIQEKEDERAKIEHDFEAFVQDLQKTFEEARMDKDRAVDAIRNSGLGLMKAVKATNSSRDDGEECSLCAVEKEL